MSKRKAIIIAAGLALGILTLAASPAGAQMVYGPGATGWGGNNSYGWSGYPNSAGDGNVSDPRFDHRQDYQQQRIQEGIDSGSLTPGEARYLEREQRRIDRAEERMAADGNLTPRERWRLNQMQNQASRDIYRLENNNRTTAGWDGGHPGWRDRDRYGDGRNYGWQGDHRGWDGRDDGWQGRDRDRDRRDWDRRNAGWQGHNRDWDGRHYGWQGNYPGGSGNNQGWQGWHGTNPVNAGNNHYWQGNGNSGWHGANSGGNGYPGGTTSGGTTSGGTTSGGTTTAGYGGNDHVNSGTSTGGTTTGGTTTTGTGTTTSGATSTAGHTRGWQGNYAGNGQTGTYQQPAAQNWSRSGQAGAWQGRQQYQQPYYKGFQPQMRPGQPSPWQGQQLQQARMQAPQPQMRANMMPQQPRIYGGMVNRANFTAPRAAPRTR